MQQGTSASAIARRIAEIASESGARAILSTVEPTVVGKFPRIGFVAKSMDDQQVLVDWFSDRDRLDPDWFDRVDVDSERRGENCFSSIHAVEDRFPLICAAAREGSLFRIESNPMARKSSFLTLWCEVRGKI